MTPLEEAQVVMRQVALTFLAGRAAERQATELAATKAELAAARQLVAAAPPTAPPTVTPPTAPPPAAPVATHRFPAAAPTMANPRRTAIIQSLTERLDREGILVNFFQVNEAVTQIESGRMSENQVVALFRTAPPFTSLEEAAQVAEAEIDRVGAHAEPLARFVEATGPRLEAIERKLDDVANAAAVPPGTAPAADALATIHLELRSIGGNVRNVETTVQAVQVTVGGVETEVRNVRTDVTALDGKVTDLAGRVQRLEERPAPMASETTPPPPRAGGTTTPPAEDLAGRRTALDGMTNEAWFALVATVAPEFGADVTEADQRVLAMFHHRSRERARQWAARKRLHDEAQASGSRAPHKAFDNLAWDIIRRRTTLDAAITTVREEAAAAPAPGAANADARAKVTRIVSVAVAGLTTDQQQAAQAQLGDLFEAFVEQLAATNPGTPEETRVLSAIEQSVRAIANPEGG